LKRSHGRGRGGRWRKRGREIERRREKVGACRFETDTIDRDDI
jgi:hypothetical protein